MTEDGQSPPAGRNRRRRRRGRGRGGASDANPPSNSEGEGKQPTAGESRPQRSTERGGERREPGSSTRSRGGRRRQRGGDERGERKARSSNPAERREQRKPVGPAGPAGPAGEETAATDPARRRRRRRRGRTDSREIQTPAAESIEPKTDALGFPDEDAWFEESPLASETAAQEDDDSAELPPERQLERDPDGEDVFALIDDEAPPQKGELQYIAAVRVHNLGDKVHLFSCKNDGVEPGTPVVVETDRGLAIGTVISRPTRQMRDSDVPKLLRALDNSDRRQQQRNVARQAEAHALCQAQIRQNRLQMKLVRTEYLHAGNKALFFFAAENRVDFRSLVKELASRLHVRIEMRQIGVRDAAGFTGGIGSCGQELCCSRFLQGFDPVSIRMAKDQNLVLNPTKVSGQCGRLKCCLAYEQKLYQEARKDLPKVGRKVRTPDGHGTIREVDILRRLVRVEREDGSFETYPANLLIVEAPVEPGKRKRDQATRELGPQE